MAANELVHIWHRCYQCGADPIVGPRYSCESCPVGPDNDLCLNCYEEYRAGTIIHPDPSVPQALGMPQQHTFLCHAGEEARSHAAWLEIPSEVAFPPVLPKGVIVRPEFRAGPHSSFAAYGFVVNVLQHRLLVTALHVMDELMKSRRIDASFKAKHYTGRELPALITAVSMYDALHKQWMLHQLGVAGPMLVLPDARTGDEEPYSHRDIAAFHVQSLAMNHALNLSEQEPQVGDSIWLVAAMQDGSCTRRGVCVENASRTMVFRFEEDKRLPEHTSGAPVLNRNGEVVGIHAGIGKMAGHELGHANPLASIRTHLRNALPPVHQQGGVGTVRLR